MYTIIIAGGSASGKSTLAARLAERLSADCRVAVIAMDSFYKPEADLPQVTTANGNTYRDYNHPESFDLERMYKAITTAKAENDTVIVEGLLTLWDEDIRKQADLRVFVDCPADVRIARRIKRNVSWGFSVEDIVDVYVDLVRFRHEQYVEPTKVQADMVVESINGLESAVETIIARLA